MVVSVEKLRRKRNREGRVARGECSDRKTIQQEEKVKGSDIRGEESRWKGRVRCMEGDTDEEREV